MNDKVTNKERNSLDWLSNIPLPDYSEYAYGYERPISIDTDDKKESKHDYEEIFGMIVTTIIILALIISVIICAYKLWPEDLAGKFVICTIAGCGILPLLIYTYEGWTWKG